MNIFCIYVKFKLKLSCRISLQQTAIADPSAKWIAFSIIEKEADVLRKAARETKHIVTDILERQPTDKHIVNAMRKRIDGFFPRQDAEELIFGPGLKENERRDVRGYALSLKLKFEMRMWKGEQYHVICNRKDIRQVVKILKEQGGQYGRYVLVPKGDCPKHSEAPFLKAIKHWQT